MSNTIRPLTIREIQAQKELKRKEETDKVTIFNQSHNQTVSVQVTAKEDKSAVYQSTILIGPKKSASIPRSRLLSDQIANLKARGLITVSGQAK